MLWLGRFHQPASAWDTEHHHGRYLQTAITRPAIENWEDEEGLIPQHITGALLESRRPLGTDCRLANLRRRRRRPCCDAASKMSRSTSSAAIPESMACLSPGRLAYLPDYVGTSSAGLLLGHDQLYVRNRGRPGEIAARITPRSAFTAPMPTGASMPGASSALVLRRRCTRPADSDESFMSGYLQVERQLPHQLTAFGRIEDSARMQDSRYVALFDDHSIGHRRDHAAAGGRFALGLRAAPGVDLRILP